MTTHNLFNEYYPRLQPLAHTAGFAYGSRATLSPEHTVSRKFTALLTEYYELGGSLMQMAEALGVTYPALRRRVMTSELKPLTGSKRSTAPEYMYKVAATMLKDARAVSSAEYHRAIKRCYDGGLSLNKLAKHVGLKSAYPLYYGLNKVRLAEQYEHETLSEGDKGD